jgi:hypothetical protein
MTKDYSKFEVPVKVCRMISGRVVRNLDDVDAVAYCAFTEEELSTEIPSGQEHSKREDGTQKTLAEYIGADPVAGHYRLAPIHFCVGRTDVFKSNSLEIWDVYLSQIGKGVDTWLTQDEYRKINNTGEAP